MTTNETKHFKKRNEIIEVVDIFIFWDPNT